MPERLTIAYLELVEPHRLQLVQRSVPPGFELRAVAGPDEEKRVSLVADADFALVSGTPVTARLLSSAPRLRLLQKLGIGYEKIDVAAASRLGVPVAITAGANTIAVAEHTMLLMLAACRFLPLLHNRLRSGEWLKWELRSQVQELHGRALGIIGLGHIGREVARRASAFGMRILYYDKVRAPEAVEQSLGARFCGLDDLLKDADVVSVHVPLSEATRHLIGHRELDLMKPTAVLVNTSRGGTVDETALAESLAAGSIRAAGIDVFSMEPPDPGHPLFALDNCVVTPHTAAGSMDTWQRVVDHAMSNIERAARGIPLPEEDLVVPPRRVAAG